MSEITYAGYGVYNQTNDATELARQAYARGERVFLAGNQWGGDPAPGQRKYLYVIWKDGSDIDSGVTGEDDRTGVRVP